MRRPPRVVVGVDDRPAGLRALRTAVAQARLLKRELLAVRAFVAPIDRVACLAAVTPGVHVPAGRTTSDSADHKTARQSIDRAFVQAMGSIPDDLAVRRAPILGEPGPILVDAAGHEEDLLVVGASTRRLLRPFRRSVAGYCASRAMCPVLLTSPPELARAVDGRHPRWRWQELDELLAENGGT